MMKAASQASGNVMTPSKANPWHRQTTPERNVALENVSSTGTETPTPLDEVWAQEGGQLLGFGYMRSYSYREVWNWIRNGTITMDGIIQGNNWANKNVIDFLSWMQRLQQLMDEARAA